MISNALHSPAGQLTVDSAISLGGSVFEAQFAQHLRTFKDPSLDTQNRHNALQWLLNEYGDQLGFDIPLERAIRDVAGENSDMGDRVQPLSIGLDCRDTLIKVGPLLTEKLGAAKIVLSPTTETSARLAALEELVTFSLTRATEDQAAISKRAVGLIVDTLNREALCKDAAPSNPPEKALPSISAQSLYSRAFNLKIVLGGLQQQ